MAKRVAVFTASRSEYGLLYSVCKAVEAHPDLELQILVAGTHTSRLFGTTLNEIIADFGRERIVILGFDGDTATESLADTAYSLGSHVLALVKTLQDIQPDYVVVYGDRYEAFAACIAASQLGICTVHVEGGDYTAGGALDDSVRHAMTKMSHLHYVTNREAAVRVERLGERLDSITWTGLPTLDILADEDYHSPEHVRSLFGLKETRPVVVFIQHSVATQAEHAQTQIWQSLVALDTGIRQHKCQVIAAYPGADAGGRVILERLEDFQKRYTHDQFQIHPSFGFRLYLGLLRVADVVIGNSSSGVKETFNPFVRIPAINIGTRQEGRLRGPNVLDVGHDNEQIAMAIDAALHSQIITQNLIQTAQNFPYFRDGKAGARIAEDLAQREPKALLNKRMAY